MKPPGTRRPAGRLAVVALALVVMQARFAAQSLSVRKAGNELQVRGSGLGLIEGRVADHLKDGRSVGVDFDVTIMETAGGAAATQGRHSFILSFDLWEQRYAVTRTGAVPRSISHLMAKDAEAWCLENVTVPLASLGRLGRDVPFWIRLEYRVQDKPPAANPGDDSPFTLRTLIDVLSRRRQDEAISRTVDAGPFRLGN